MATGLLMVYNVSTRGARKVYRARRRWAQGNALTLYTLSFQCPLIHVSHIPVRRSRLLYHRWEPYTGPSLGQTILISCFLRKGDGKATCEWSQLQQQQLAGMHLTVVLIRLMLLVVSHRSSCSAPASFHAVVSSGTARSLFGLFNCFFACLMQTPFLAGLLGTRTHDCTAFSKHSALSVGNISHSNPVTLFSLLVPNVIVTLHHLPIQFSQTKLVIAM